MKLIILIGPPSSGKTTWINKLIDKTNKNYFKISRDDIVEKIAFENNMTYDDIFERPHVNQIYGNVHPLYGKVIETKTKKLLYDKLEYLNSKIFRLLNAKFDESIKSNLDIIIDMTNMNIKSRKLVFNKFENILDDYEKIAVVFNNGGVGLNYALFNISNKRSFEIELKGGKKTISMEIIDNMISSYTPPSLSEGFDSIEYVNNMNDMLKNDNICYNY